jgi:hypothetical protein
MAQEFTAGESAFERDYLTCASRLAESLYAEAYVEINEAVALLYVEAGQLERGVEQAERMPDAYARDSALALITPKAVASGNEDYALELVETIDDPILRNSAIENMSIEFARCGDFDTALSLTDQLTDYDSAFASIATIYWQSDLKNEAVELARSIEFAQQRAMTMALLAKLSNENEESSELLVEAQDVAEEIDTSELKAYALLAIASVYEGQEDREHSLEVLNRALEVCEEFESTGPIGLSGSFARDEVLLQILQAFLRLDDISKATEVADAIEDQFLFARANLGLAVARARDGEPTQSTEYLDEAREMITELQPYSNQEAGVRDALIIDLAMSYANARNYAEARRLTHLVTSEQMQALAFKELGKLCSRAGDDHWILEIEKDLRGRFDKIQYWLGIYSETNSDDPDMAERALTKALETAKGIEQPVEKAEALTELAVTLTKNQRSTQAESLFLAATNATTLIEGNFLKAQALIRLAKASQDADRNPSQNEQALLEKMISTL